MNKSQPVEIQLQILQDQIIQLISASGMPSFMVDGMLSDILSSIRGQRIEEMARYITKVQVELNQEIQAQMEHKKETDLKKKEGDESNG